jgi:CRISPR-associated protein Cst1
MIRRRRDENLKKEVENIQVIKYDPDSGYTFNLLSKQVIAVIDRSKKELNLLAEQKNVSVDSKNWINLYSEVIDRIYRNIDLYPLIYLMMALSLKRKWTNRHSELIFRINMNFIGGNMSDKKIYAMKQLGLKLKKGYKGKDASNKIQGIAYRLLNFLKTKNTNGFLDVVINCHMHIGAEVPTLFVECIDDEERFQAYGYAFLLGFTGEEYKKNSEAGNQESNK